MNDDEAAQVAEALEVPPASLRLLSREPLGTGSVTGFAVAGAEPEIIVYLDSSHRSVETETGLVREDGVRIWQHPADPHLPALAPVAFQGGAETLLDRLGLGPVRTMEMVAYRPGRRAILRVGTDADVPVWVKVVRPSRVDRIVAAHRELLAAGLPVPEIPGWSPEGLLVLSNAEGTPATDARWEPERLLDAVDDLRARLARATLGHPARTSLGDRLEWYVARLRTALPEDSRIDEVTGEVERMLAAPAPEPVTIHGDLHLGQLFLGGADGHDITGLVDVDTAGSGDAADDAAAFLAHAVTSAIATVAVPAGAATAARVWNLAAAAGARWGDARVTALARVHLLGHALGASADASAGGTERAHRLLEIATGLQPEMSKNGLMALFERPYL